MLIRPTLVAESDEAAWEQAAPAIVRFWQVARDNFISPEPLRPEDLPAITAKTGGFRGGATVQNLDEWNMVLVGSPATVTRKVLEIARTAAPTTLIGEFSFGTLAHPQVCRSLELFAREVMPQVQAELAKEAVSPAPTG
jgi:alkanesulfonate monooxygenase SsuD/methylene tetrahydromethanopterin reductase-like flavin-dependent oxidoreductase (luciferase family)